MNKDQFPTFTVAEVRRFQDGKWGMPPAEVLLATRLQDQDPTVGAAERVSQKFRELDEAIQELGTSVTQADMALQDLQEVSKDLVDLEIVISSGYSTDPAPTPLVRPVLQGGHTLNENQRPTSPRIQTITAGQSFARLAPEVHREMLRALREPDAPAPWYKCLWPWILSIPEPLTDGQMLEAVEGLEHVLRLPWYKRLPALILWLWRLP